MKRTAWLGAAFLVWASGAQAQAPVYNWSGFYVGVHAGYGLGTSELGPETAVDDLNGALAGGQVGFNQQIGNLLIGVEADLSWSGISGNSAYTVGGPSAGIQTDRSSGIDVNWIASLTGRAGLAVDRLVVYGKGGFAWVNYDQDFSASLTLFAPPFSATQTFTGSETRFAPIFGAGAEYAFADRWSARVEYNYIGLPTSRLAMSGPIAVTGNVDQHLHLLKLGVNYRLVATAPQPQVAPIRATGYDWTGFYAGVQTGYAWGREDWLGFTAPAGRYRTDGWLAGGQVGANVQAGRFVVGVEADWMWTGVDGGQATQVLGVSSNFASDVRWLATATARLGVVPWDRALLYAKAGGALAEIRQDLVQHSLFLGNLDFSGTSYVPGYVFGLGYEHALFGNWSAKIEYDYVNFFRHEQILAGTIATPAYTVPNSEFFRHMQSLQMVKLGLNYRFAPAP